MLNLKIDVHVMVILATRTFREKKKKRPSLFLDYIQIMSPLTWIIEKELERELKNKGEEFR